MFGSLCRVLAAIVIGAACIGSSNVRADELCSIKPGTYAVAKDAYPAMRSALSEMEKHSTATCPESSRLSVVVYGLPNKDCAASYSSGGSVKSVADYERFLTTLTSIVGNRKILYVLEPDAVGLLSGGGCGEQAGYRENLKSAIRVLSSNPNAEIYLDVGYWTLQSTASAVAGVIKTLVGAGRVKGIALNTSNYRSNAEISNLCWNFQSAMGSNDYHCIADTSRNLVAPSSSEWCNVKTAGIGAPPTSNTGYWNLDYFMWIKVPGESDGKCNDGTHSSDAMIGSDAGAFFAEHFKLMWNQGYFVNKLGFSKIGAADSGGSSSCAASGNSCGSAWSGAGCCATAGDYCQPWNPGFYQCRAEPLRCGKQQVGVDFYGDDLVTHYRLLPEYCCGKCAETSGLKAHTFVNYNSDGKTACYLKKGTGTRRSVERAVSTEVLTPVVVCPTEVGGCAD
ncbi:Glycoside hydrolase, partial [Globisporangium splendens]